LLAGKAFCKKASKRFKKKGRVEGYTMKKRTSYTLTEEALKILERLAKKRGIYKSTLLDELLRDEDQREYTRVSRKSVLVSS
jgi:DNA-binding transcriptional regulator PaaX